MKKFIYGPSILARIVDGALERQDQLPNDDRLARLFDVAIQIGLFTLWVQDRDPERFLMDFRSDLRMIEVILPETKKRWDQRGMSLLDDTLRRVFPKKSFTRNYQTVFSDDPKIELSCILLRILYDGKVVIAPNENERNQAVFNAVCKPALLSLSLLFDTDKTEFDKRAPDIDLALSNVGISGAAHLKFVNSIAGPQWRR